MMLSRFVEYHEIREQLKSKSCARKRAGDDRSVARMDAWHHNKYCYLNIMHAITSYDQSKNIGSAF